MTDQLAGKVAVVTGAASGIGRTIATALVRAGANAVIADVNEEWGTQVAAGLRDAPGRARFVRTDVRDSASVDGLVEQTVVEMTDDEWDFQVDTQLRGVFLTCRAAARRMITQGRGGRIVNIGSTAGAVARVRAAAHCASKAGVVQFTKVLALRARPLRDHRERGRPGAHGCPCDLEGRSH